MSDLPEVAQPAEASVATGTVDRREFVEKIAAACAAGLPVVLGVVGVPGLGAQADSTAPATPQYDASKHYFGMGVDPAKCIGCGRCVNACKTENDVPREEGAFNTWIERYVIRTDGSVEVDSPDGGLEGFPEPVKESEVRKSFFVPKLCNHCANPPCVQVCPVGATFITRDGVVLVDKDYCIGCRYCIQACPYGARWFDEQHKVAAKCTFCYHRITKGLVPACVEACPTSARIFGEVEGRATPLARFIRFNDIQVLKPSLNTRPKVYYANLDGEVR